MSENMPSIFTKPRDYGLQQKQKQKTILERFKNQPTILKLPTPLTKTRQLNQSLQRNRRNIRTLLPLTNKQSNLRHFKPPSNQYKT